HPPRRPERLHARLAIAATRVTAARPAPAAPSPRTPHRDRRRYARPRRAIPEIAAARRASRRGRTRSAADGDPRESAACNTRHRVGLQIRMHARIEEHRAARMLDHVRRNRQARRPRLTAEDEAEIGGQPTAGEREDAHEDLPSLTGATSRRTPVT